VQAALHKDLALAFVDQFDASGGRSGFRGRRIDDLVAGDVEIVLGGDLPDLGRRPNQGRLDDPGLRRIDRAAQRTFITGMHDDGRYRGNALRSRNEAVIF
jgi:hypothetical protein